jgi:hypothetical protein
VTRKTDGEKIDELEKLVAVMRKQVRILEKNLDALTLAGKDTAQRLTDLHREVERGIGVLQAVLQKDIDELRRWTEKNGTADIKSEVNVLKEKTTKLEAAQDKAVSRAWSVVPNIVGAVVSGILAAIVAYFVARR